MVKRICVFCGSNPGSREAYTLAASELATTLVARNITIVYGGGHSGLMGTLADTVLADGGNIIGIMPRALVVKERAHLGIPDLRVVESMHARKALMAELSDAFVALPGGYGTLEEFCEILTWTQLGIEQKPCGILNVEGYYDHLLQLFDHAVAEQFVKREHREMVISADNPELLVNRLLAYHPMHTEKWLSKNEN